MEDGEFVGMDGWGKRGGGAGKIGGGIGRVSNRTE